MFGTLPDKPKQQGDLQKEMGIHAKIYISDMEIYFQQQVFLRFVDLINNSLLFFLFNYVLLDSKKYSIAEILERIYKSPVVTYQVKLFSSKLSLGTNWLMPQDKMSVEIPLIVIENWQNFDETRTLFPRNQPKANLRDFEQQLARSKLSSLKQSELKSIFKHLIRKKKHSETIKIDIQNLKMFDPIQNLFMQTKRLEILFNRALFINEHYDFFEFLDGFIPSPDIPSIFKGNRIQINIHPIDLHFTKEKFILFMTTLYNNLTYDDKKDFLFYNVHNHVYSPADNISLDRRFNKKLNSMIINIKIETLKVFFELDRSQGVLAEITLHSPEIKIEKNSEGKMAMRLASRYLHCQSPIISKNLEYVSPLIPNDDPLEIIKCFGDLDSVGNFLFHMDMIINPSSTNVLISLSNHILVMAPQIFLRILQITKMTNEMSVNNLLNEFFSSVQKSLHFKFLLKQGALSFMHNFLLRVPLLGFDYHKFFDNQRFENFSIPMEGNFIRRLVF